METWFHTRLPVGRSTSAQKLPQKPKDGSNLCFIHSRSGIMASYDDSQNLRGVKRSLDEDDMDFPDLDLLDPRNHSPVVAATVTGREVNANSGSSDTSIAPKPAKFLKTNDGKAEPTTSHGSSSHASGLEHFTESLHKPSTSETGSLDTTSQPYTSVPGTSGTAGNNDDVLQLPTTTASVLTQLDKSMSSGADSESDTEEKKLVDIETCSNASSPTKSPKKQSDQKDKDKKVSEDKNEEEDAAALLRNKREKQEEERLKMQYGTL